MGACYSVTLKVNVTDVPSAINALNQHIVNDTRSNYSLEEYAQQGITTETFDDLIRIFLANWPGQEVDIQTDNGFTVYENGFNASYGWECVMMDMFATLAPFITDGSELYISIDNDYDKLVIKNGKCVQLH